MKKTLLSISLILTFGFAQAQALLTENFDVAPPATWTQLNQSTPEGSNPLWFQGNSDNFPSYAGAPGSYVSVNYNSVAGNNTISNWLFTPTVSLQNGDVISFYTRTTSPAAFPDRLEMRIGSSTAAAPVGPTGVGGYTTLALTVNSGLTLSGYPTDWTLFTYTVTGLTGVTASKIAFRYFVTSGGPSGANSDIIGIDSFSVNRPLSTQDFFSSNFSIFPNPVNDIFNITSKNGTAIESIQVLDINGRIVNQINNSSSDTVQLNVANLNAGVYFVKVQSELGVGTTRIIKN